MHGGSVEVHSDGVGKGCEFVVRLPVLLSPAQGERPAGDGVGEAHPATRYRVLVVDDNKDAALSLAMLLKLMGGHDTRTAHDGLAAVEAAEQFRPDVVLLDLGLPDIDGMVVLETLREWTDVAVIVLTVRDDEPSKVKAMDLGADDYVTKPFDMADLVERMSAALGRRTAG
jgi:DNA-binding response OmpR family regulator